MLFLSRLRMPGFQVASIRLTVSPYTPSIAWHSPDRPSMSTLHDSDNEEHDSSESSLLYNVVYCSRAAASVDDATVDRIIETSRRRNHERHITGLLVFGSGIFFQWLEGPRDPVTQLMTTLKADPRHESVLSLSESEEVRERLFSDWDMERVSPDDIRDVLEDALSTAENAQHAEALASLLAHLDSGQLSGLIAA